MGTYGLGDALMGANRAMDNIETKERSDAQYEQGLEDAQYKRDRQVTVDERVDATHAQGLEDQEYTRDRQKMTHERQDEQYKLTKQDQDFNRNVEQSMREFAVTGNLGKGLDAYNSVNDGYEARSANPLGTKGQYEIEFVDKESGEVVGKQSFDKDSIGSLFMEMRDPMYRYKREAEAAKERTAQENAMELQGSKNDAAIDVANIRAASTGEKSASKIFTAHRKVYEKNLGKESLAGFLSLDGVADAVDRATEYGVALEKSGMSREASVRKVGRDIEGYAKEANKRAVQELGGSASEEDIEARTKQMLDVMVDNRLKQISSPAAQGDDNSPGGKNSSKASHTNGGEYFERLKETYPDASDEQINKSVLSKYPDWQAGNTVAEPEPIADPIAPESIDTASIPNQIARPEPEPSQETIGLELAQGEDIKSNLDQPDAGLDTTMLETISNDEGNKKQDTPINFDELGLKTEDEMKNSLADKELANRAAYDKQEAPIKKLAKKHYNRHQKKEAIDYVNKKIAAGIVPSDKQKVLLALKERSRLSARVRRKLEKVAQKMGLIDDESMVASK